MLRIRPNGRFLSGYGYLAVKKGLFSHCYMKLSAPYEWLSNYHTKNSVKEGLLCLLVSLLVGSSSKLVLLFCCEMSVFLFFSSFFLGLGKLVVLYEPKKVYSLLITSFQKSMGDGEVLIGLPSWVVMRRNSELESSSVTQSRWVSEIGESRVVPSFVLID